MSDGLLIAAGLLLVLLVFVDALMTTISVSAGAGPVTKRVLGLCWRGFLALHRPDSRSSLLNAAGVLLLVGTVLMWVAGLWTGWFLVLLGSDTAVASNTGAPVGTTDVWYLSGYLIFTLGTGDVVAASSTWRLVTAAAAFSGLFLVTLAITYLTAVVSAVVVRRRIALQVTGLGSSAVEIIRRAWDGKRFSSMFEQQLITLTPDVMTTAEQHLAYPVLHYFHASQPSLAAPLAIAQLDDVMVLIDAIEPDHRPDENAVAPIRFAMDRYVRTATEIAWVPQAPAPTPPDASTLDDAGIPWGPGGVAGAASARADRRAKLNQLVVSDGWTWR